MDSPSPSSSATSGMSSTLADHIFSRINQLEARVAAIEQAKEDPANTKKHNPEFSAWNNSPGSGSPPAANVQSIEAINTSTPLQATSLKRPASPLINENEESAKQPRVDDVRAQGHGVQGNRDSKQCIFCERYGHIAVQCVEYPSRRTRMQRAIELKRCLKCVVHMADKKCLRRPPECSSDHCSRDHHPAFCPKRDDEMLERQ